MSPNVDATTTLVEIQERVLAGEPQTVVVVEGLSDCFALEAVAVRLGCELDERGVAVLPTGGVTNIGRFLDVFGPAGRNVRVAGLCDEREGTWLRARFDRAGVPASGLFVCHRDLEEELIRAVGPSAVVEVIEREGEGESLRRMQQMPFHRGGAIEGHLHRFMGSKSGRKHRYARLLAEAVDASRVPPPLRDLVASL